MQELELRDSSRENTIAFIEELREARDHSSDGDDEGSILIDNYTRDLLDGMIRRAKRVMLPMSPFTLNFVYHPEGEILIKGFLHDVKLHIEKNYPVYICRRVTYDNRIRWNFRSDSLIRGHGRWIGSKGIEIYRPRPPKSVRLYSMSPRKDESFKTLRKWRVDIAGFTFFFKRMPNKWLPIFTESLEVAKGRRL